MNSKSKHDASMNRREFLKGMGTCSVVAGGVVLGSGAICEEENKEDKKKELPEVETNLADFMKVPKAEGAIPGPFPGKVVEVKDAKSLVEDKVDKAVVRDMMEKGITGLTGKNMKESFELLFKPEDIVGIKINPVGPVINTRLEVTDAVIQWLVDSGMPKTNIVIWDRFDKMLDDAGYTKENFPGVRIEALQTMDLTQGGTSWRKEDGTHVSADKFDMDAYYFAKGIEGKGVANNADDELYLNQHVVNTEYSYFGKLITQELTKIINLPVFKNTGGGVSMATKNIGYAAVNNTGRLHQPIFFRVCTEVLAAPWVRDKLVLNIIDGLRGQYEGGPGFNAQFVYDHHTLYFATDPFAVDMLCHTQLKEKRKAMEVKVSDNPIYTDYLFQAEELGLGIVDMEKIEHIQVMA